MKHLFVFVFTILTITLSAQDKMKYGKVSDAEMKMTSYAADPDAEAVVLGEAMRVIFSVRNGKLMLTYYYHTRIKILSKKGMEQANVAIRYWSNRRGENITKIKAQTLNWKDGEIVKTELTKEEIFTDKIDDYRSVKKFAFPAVEVGSVLEYYYEMDSHYFTSINDYYFQSNIPVIWSSYSVEVLESLKYRFDLQGNHPFSAQTQSPITLNQAEGMLGTEYYWLMKNIPALKREPYITSMRDYYAGVRMRLSSYEPKNSFHERYISTWPSMNALYFKEIAKENYLKENYSDLIWSDAKKVINSSMKPLEQVDALYQFVQKSIKWNGFDEINPDHTADYCYKEKKGSNTEINMTLLSLLRKAGIEAYPLLISTRDNGKTMNFLPYLYQFNQTLIVAVIDGKTYQLDASHEDYPMNILHPNNLNAEGWIIIDENEGRWVNINASLSTEVVLPTLRVREDGIVEGQLKVLSKGYVAFHNREVIKGEGKEKYLQTSILEKLPNSKVENHEILNLENLNESLEETMDFSGSDLTQVAGDLIYLKPFIKTTFSENPFKSEKRVIPVDMSYGIDHQVIMKIEIPKGYYVDELPKTTKITLPNDGGVFSFVASHEEGVIQIISKMKIKQTYFQPSEYVLLREFMDLVVNKQNEQIVLKKLP